MFSCDSMMSYLFLELDACNFEDRKHALKMPNEQFPSIRVPKNHYVSIVQGFSILIYVLQFHLPSWIKGNVVKDHHQLTQEVVNFYGRFKLRCNEYLNWSIMFQYFIELIEHSLVILFNELLSSFLLVFYCNGFLPHFRGELLPLFLLLHFDLVFDYCALVVNFDSFDLILDLIGLLFIGSMELADSLRPWLHYFVLGLSALFLFVRLWLSFFYHC